MVHSTFTMCLTDDAVPSTRIFVLKSVYDVFQNERVVYIPLRIAVTTRFLQKENVSRLSNYIQSMLMWL